MKKLLRASKLTTALFPLTLVGCVAQSQYLQVESERDQARASVKTLQHALDQEKANGESLTLQLVSARAERSANSRERSRYQSSVDELAKRKAEADARAAEYRYLLEKFEPLSESGRLRARVEDGRMVVMLPTDRLFAAGSATLSPEGKVAVAEVSGVLGSIPNGRFQVAGHTDRALGSSWELASARSLSVLKTMLDCGLNPEHVSAASFGDAAPAPSNASAPGSGAPQRIEISVTPDAGHVGA